MATSKAVSKKAPEKVLTPEEKLKVALEIPKLADMKKNYAGVGEVVTKLSSIVIKKEEDYQIAETYLKQSNELIKSFDKSYESATESAKGWIKSVDWLYDFITAPINLGINDLKRKMQKFQADEDIKRRQKIADLEAKKTVQAQVAENADTTTQQVKAIEKIEAIENKQVVLTSTKSKTADKVRKFEIVNPELVERQYCTPEDKKIRPFIGEVNGPIPEIKGVRIWDEFKIVSR